MEDRSWLPQRLNRDMINLSGEGMGCISSNHEPDKPFLLEDASDRIFGHSNTTSLIQDLEREIVEASRGPEEATALD